MATQPTLVTGSTVGSVPWQMVRATPAPRRKWWLKRLLLRGVAAPVVLVTGTAVSSVP